MLIGPLTFADTYWNMVLSVVWRVRMRDSPSFHADMALLRDVLWNYQRALNITIKPDVVDDFSAAIKHSGSHWGFLDKWLDHVEKHLGVDTALVLTNETYKLFVLYSESFDLEFKVNPPVESLVYIENRRKLQITQDNQIARLSFLPIMPETRIISNDCCCVIS